MRIQFLNPNIFSVKENFFLTKTLALLFKSYINPNLGPYDELHLIHEEKSTLGNLTITS